MADDDGPAGERPAAQGPGGEGVAARASSEPEREPPPREVLALPEPAAGGGGGGVLQAAPQQIDVSAAEASLALDHLGPVVVNTDGSLSRIMNWVQMTEREQQVTRQRVAKRNNERLAALRAAADEQG